MKKTWTREYSPESLCDVDRDVTEAIAELMPEFKYEGSFKIVIEYDPDN